MRTRLFYLFLFFTFSINSFSQMSAETRAAISKQSIQDQIMDRYVVIAGTSIDYNYLESQSKKISKKTGLKFDNEGMEYDKKRGMIVPDSLSDEMYADSYFPRRYSDERISIEMMWYYQDSASYNSSKDMIIITGIFENKEDAQKQLEKVKSVVPTAYIKKKGIYMGCMH